jgi:hypothetical protein
MVKVEKVAYAGWPNCRRLFNDSAELIVTTDVGPRIIRFAYIGGENILYENPDEIGKTGGQEWRLYGGHRLWHSPEDTVRTYFPDNFACEVQELEDGLIVTGPLETSTGMQKSMEIHLAPGEARATIIHRIKNHGLWPVTCAPWGVTVMAGEGTAIIPLTRRTPWPKILLPTHSITFWSYTCMTDPRFTWGDSYVMLRQEPIRGKEQKIGLNNTEGWAAYRLKDQLFIKEFDYFPDETYADRNSNFECFTNFNTLELETIAPQQPIAPGAEASHRETWQLHKGMTFALKEAEIDAVIPALLKP